MTGPRTSSLYKAVHDDPSTPGLDTPLNEPGPSNIPSGTIVYSKKAPKVPESVIARSKVNKSHAKLRANVRKATDGDDDALKKILEKMHADNAEDIDMQNPNTKRLREAVLVTWAIFLTEIRPDLSSDNHWDHSIVQSYAKTYLEYRACYTRGRKGGSIKASTLTQTLSNLVHCVWNYTTDAHGNRAGKKLLTEGGLHKKLEDKVKQLITEYELDRYEDEKVYYGRHEVRLMIAEAMSNSQTAGSGRLPKVQTVCTTLFPMFCTVRPSSLGPNNPQFEKEGKFPRLGDLRVFRRAYMTYDIQFDCKHFKGHNEGLGRWLVFLLQSVERCHNVVFDPTLWIIAYLFLRGAFDFPTLEEFFSFEGAEVVIKDDKKKEPLFCQSTPGGRDLETTKPISSKSISECVATLAINVGLPRAGLGALRRESGNNFGITMGKHVAAMILNHREEATTFDLHYSRNTGNYPVVGIQLGEISSVENDEMTKRMLALNDFSRAAVTALLTQKSIASWDVEKDGEKIVERKSVKGKTRSAVPVLSQSAKAEIEDDKIIKNASDTFTKHPRTKNWAPNMQNVTRMKTGKGVSIVDEDRIPDLVKRLTEVNKILTERRKSLRRAATRKMQQGQHNQLAKKLADEVDTTDARNEILRDIETADSTFLTDAQNLTLDESTRCADHIAAFMTLPAAELKVYWMKWAEQQQSASNCADSDDEPDHDHEHFRSAIRSARDALGDGKEPLHNAQRATHAPHNSNIAPGEDEDQISLGDGVERQGEPDLIQLDIAILKRRMVEYICAPVFEERREREEFKANNGTWMCKLCKLWTHCPERASKTFSSKGSRDRHIERWHDPWYDLEVKMITDDKLVFKCPSEDYQGTSTFDVRLHCLSASCVDHGKYVDMEANAKHRFKVTAEGSIEVQHDEEATQAVEPVVKGDESDQDLGVAFLSAGVDAVVEAAQNRGITITPEQRENLEGLYMSLQVAQAVRTTDQRDHHTHHAAVRRAALSLFIDGRCAELLALLDISDTA